MSVKLKGPLFPSHQDQNHARHAKKVMVWNHHQSTRQVKRNLRNRCQHLIDSKDPEIISVGDRVIRAVCMEPDPEFSALHLFHAALEASEDTGEPWIVCMTYIMDKFDEQKEVQDAAPTRRDPADKPKGGLLRSFISRTFGRRYARITGSCEPGEDRGSDEGEEALDADPAAGGSRTGAVEASRTGAD